MSCWTGLAVCDKPFSLFERPKYGLLCPGSANKQIKDKIQQLLWPAIFFFKNSNCTMWFVCRRCRQYTMDFIGPTQEDLLQTRSNDVGDGRKSNSRSFISVHFPQDKLSQTRHKRTWSLLIISNRFFFKCDVIMSRPCVCVCGSEQPRKKPFFWLSCQSPLRPRQRGANLRHKSYVTNHQQQEMLLMDKQTSYLLVCSDLLVLICQ